ncbi:hypothetical protein Tco_0108728 [Tanacetum coccineum]
MSDSEDFTITYTEVSSPFEDLSDIGSPRVDGLPMLPEDPYAYMVTAFKAPPSPDYVPGPKEPEQAPPLPEFVLEPVYPEFIPPEDEDEEDLEEDPEEDSEKNPADYPANKGDDDDESSEDDEDDDDNDVEEDKDGEEEGDHPALANSVPPPVHRVTARMFVRDQIPISFPLDTKILSLPLPVSPPPLPVSPTYPLGYRAVMIRLRAETPFTSQLLQSSTPPSGTPPLLPIPLTTPSPPLLLPSTVFRAVHLLPLLDPLEALDQIMDSLALWMMRLDETPTEMLVMGLQIHRTKWLRTCRGHQVAGSRPHSTSTTYGDTNTDEDTADTGDSTPELIDQGVANALAARDANKIRNGEDNHDSRPGGKSKLLLLMETVFRISNCIVENQIKFATCTLLGSALTWWNFHVKNVGHDVAYAMTWTNLEKKITDKMFPEESDKIEKYRRSALLLNDRVKTKESKMITNNNNNRTRGKTLAGFMLQGLGHFKRDCPKLRNNNHGNQGGNGNAPAKVYAVGRAGTNPDSNVITGMFLLNNRYASVLFDTGADRRFVSTAFSSQIDIKPSTLDHLDVVTSCMVE